LIFWCINATFGNISVKKTGIQKNKIIILKKKKKKKKQKKKKKKKKKFQNQKSQRGKINTHSAHIHDHSPSWLGIGDNLVFFSAQASPFIEMMYKLILLGKC
jgi:hypothetical protein